MADKTWIFDMDDTLIKNHHLYLLPEIKFAEYVFRKIRAGKEDMDVIDYLKMYVMKNGYASIHDLARVAREHCADKAEHFCSIYDVQEKIDMDNVKSLGFTMDRFPESFRQALLHFSHQYGFRYEPEDLLCVENIAKEAFNILPNVVEGAIPVLNFLCEQGDELYLFTKGDRELQHRKIIINDLDIWFSEENIHIVEDKTNHLLENIVGEKNKDTTWTVGNSAGSDIAPAIELGLRAIYIPVPTWMYEREKPLPQSDRIITLPNISQIIEKYATLP